jgi:hypothetical protein
LFLSVCLGLPFAISHRHTQHRFQRDRAESGPQTYWESARTESAHTPLIAALTANHCHPLPLFLSLQLLAVKPILSPFQAFFFNPSCPLPGGASGPKHGEKQADSYGEPSSCLLPLASFPSVRVIRATHTATHLSCSCNRNYARYVTFLFVVLCYRNCGRCTTPRVHGSSLFMEHSTRCFDVLYVDAKDDNLSTPYVESSPHAAR